MQSREGELAYPFQGSVLQGELLEPVETPEGERGYPRDGVPVQVQLPDVFVPLESVRFQVADAIFGEGQVLHSGRQVIRNVSEPSSITQDL